MNPYAKMRSKIWDRHIITLKGRETRTAYGTVYGEPTLVKASVSVTERQVVTQSGEDTTVAATIKWAVDGPLPAIGDKLSLPDYFGMKPDRTVITSRRVMSGTGLTPDHVEVTVR